MLANSYNQPEMLGRGKNGLLLAKLNNKVVYVEDIHMNLQVLEKFNESNYVCKIVACLETSNDDHQIATKIAIENPLGEDDCPDSTMPLEEFIENLSKHPTESGKAQF